MERSALGDRWHDTVLRLLPKSLPSPRFGDAQPIGIARQATRSPSAGDAPATVSRYDTVIVRSEPGSRTHAVEREILAYTDALYQLARYLTGRPSDAEDLVQETFIRALAAAPRLGVESNLKAWLFRILRNAFHDTYRREKKHRAAESLDEETAADIAVSGDAELEALRSATVRAIETAMATLGEDGRTVILLDLEGFTETEISEIMGCAVGTVKSRLLRARANLRKQLGREAGRERS
jgi:RNA polymerase sigma-70 factor (ECF subfamily)